MVFFEIVVVFMSRLCFHTPCGPMTSGAVSFDYRKARMNDDASASGAAGAAGAVAAAAGAAGVGRRHSDRPRKAAAAAV